MTESSDKPILILTESNWSKWSAIAKIKFKMIKAWEMIEEKKKLSDFDDDTVKQEKYRELALKVNLILMSGTEGHDNEIVIAQDAEDISTAWYKLVEKHEGSQDEVLLKTFDNIALESFKELKDTDIYVERYLNWAMVIKQKAESIDNLVKLIITTNMFRTLPKDFESVKERIRADLDDYELKDIADAVKTRAREILKDEKYKEQFSNLKRTSSEEEIDRMNAELNAVGWMNSNQSDRSPSNSWNSGWSSGQDYKPDQLHGWSSGSNRGSYNFRNPNYKGKPWNYIEDYRPWSSRSHGDWRNTGYENGERRTGSNESAKEGESGGGLQKFAGSLNAIGYQKTSPEQNLKPKKILGYLAGITGLRVANDGQSDGKVEPKSSEERVEGRSSRASEKDEEIAKKAKVKNDAGETNREHAERQEEAINNDREMKPENTTRRTGRTGPKMTITRLKKKVNRNCGRRLIIWVPEGYELLAVIDKRRAFRTNRRHTERDERADTIKDSQIEC